MFRGWVQLNGVELANTSRLIAHMSPTVPVRDDQVAPMMDCACDIHIGYDDSWTGLEAAIGDGPYTITNAPWYNAARPESAEFAGVWLMDVTGMEAVPVQREIMESICAGGIASRSRDTTRTVNFSALVVACTNAGLHYGLDWLACVLRQSSVRGGVDMDFYRAHPEDTSATADSLRRTMFGMVMTQPPVRSEMTGKGGSARHRQASIYRVEWEMVATQPYMYGAPTATAVTWDSTAVESITWAHAPDCEDSTACDLPTIYNAACIPPDVRIEAAVVPTCGGCLPICEIERRTYELETSITTCDDIVVSIRVTNDGADPLTVNLYWQPCGSTDLCDRVHPLQISGLAQNQTAVADSVTGRPYIDIAGVSHRQVGIVSTPTGAPWRPIQLEAVMCWELVAESTPGADYTVVIETRDRDA